MCVKTDAVHSGISHVTMVNGEPTWHPTYFDRLSADNQIKAGQEGAIEVIVNAMNAHIKNGDVCKFGCGALKNITRGNGK